MCGFGFNVCSFGFNVCGFGFNGFGFNGVGYIYVTYRLHIKVSVTYQGANIGYIYKGEIAEGFPCGFFVFFSRVWFQCSVSVSNWYLGILESSA